MDKDELLKKLMEEHKDDFAGADIEDINEKDDNAGGDSSKDNPEDAASGADDSSDDDKTEPKDNEDERVEKKTREDEVETTKSNDSDDSRTERVGEKKDANSRIRQLLEEKKELAFKLAEKEAEERKALEAKEDPVYTLEQFLDSGDDDGNPLTETEAKAKFEAWKANYELRQYQKTQVLKDQQSVLINLQRETSEAFDKFPEFNIESDKYDEKLASLANMMFEAGLEYDNKGNIVGSKINPGELLSGLHGLRNQPQATTKVNNLGDDTGRSISSQQINKANATKYAPNFRGEVDKELDNLIAKRNGK